MPRMAIVEFDGEDSPFGTQIIEDDSVQFHDGSAILLPKNITYEIAELTLRRKREDEETVTEFPRDYRYRPNDGAHATMMVLRKKFGITRGKGIPKGWFGEQPPELVTIDIGPKETKQVAWGCIQIPTLEGASLYTLREHSEEFGVVFKLMVNAKRKYKDEIEKLFDEVQEYLENNSIYRGKALIGHEEPKFLDLSEFRPSNVIYSEKVARQLESGVLAVIRYTEAFRREGIPRKRAILLHGPYGTGKTLTGQVCAFVCENNGWTFIAARPGQDDLVEALQTAKLYEPACVFFEDVDETASSPDQGEMSRLMEAFDGITAKGGELLAVMTTNHIERIAKPLLRPGRLDALIEIEHLDRPGIERLVKSIVADEKLDGLVNWDEVHVAMEGFYPAFISEVCNRASAVALGRSKGEKHYVLTTDDLVIASESLRPQFNQMEQANEGRKRPVLESVLAENVQDAVEEQLTRRVNRSRFVDQDGDVVGTLRLRNHDGSR